MGALQKVEKDLDIGETYDRQLDKWGTENIPGFMGVLRKDALEHQRFRPGQSWVFNLDDERGTHWVGLRISNQKKVAMYVDPFGFPPPDILTRAVWKHKYPMYYTDTDSQKLHENNCGQRALAALYRLAHSRNDWVVFHRL